MHAHVQSHVWAQTWLRACVSMCTRVCAFPTRTAFHPQHCVPWCAADPRASTMRLRTLSRAPGSCREDAPGSLPGGGGGAWQKVYPWRAGSFPLLALARVAPPLSPAQGYCGACDLLWVFPSSPGASGVPRPVSGQHRPG